MSGRVGKHMIFILLLCFFFFNSTLALAEGPIRERPVQTKYFSAQIEEQFQQKVQEVKQWMKEIKTEFHKIFNNDTMYKIKDKINSFLQELIDKINKEREKNSTFV